jgi:ribosomal protein L3 glutamine methyltransferase
MNTACKTLDQYLKTIHTALQAADLYYGHGSDNAWDEAVYLLLSALELPLDSGEEVLTYPVSPAQASKIESWLEQRVKQRLPLPYITHEAWFAGLPFYVDERVLIPRSLMGPWLLENFSPWLQPDKVHDILEIGTGSGCIAIVAAKVFEQAQVVAADIDAAALAVAEKNISRHAMTERVQLLQSDLFSNIVQTSFDLILSNPPYVSFEEMADVPAEYNHEPVHALAAEDEGMALVMEILRKAPAYLKPQGILVVEVGYSDEVLMTRYPNAPWVWLDTDADSSGLFLIGREALVQFLAEMDE